MSTQRLCARMSAYFMEYQKSCKDISMTQDGSSNQGQPLVNSPKLAWDFDNFASDFAENHELCYLTPDNKKISRCLSSVDAIILDSINDKIILVEFKYDKVGHPERNKKDGGFHFVYNKSERDYELWIYRKFTESLIMLMSDCGLEFEECARKVQGLLVLNAGDNHLTHNTNKTNHLRQFSIRTRGSYRRELHTLKQLEGALFSSVQVLSEKAFDDLFPSE